MEQLPHTKGDWAISIGGRDNRIKLEPWQCFIFCSVFGWVHRSTGLRRFRIAYICIPRKNGKSILAAGTGLYMLASDAEYGAEVYAGATCKRQAWEVFRPAKLMVQRTPRLKEVFGIHVGAHNIAVLENGSRFEPVVRQPGDGASPSCAIVDEYHEHKTDELVDTMRTGMGARKQPLLWIITTAGSNIAGPCHDLQRDVERVLEGSIQQDELFGIVFTLDEGDDWTSFEALKKANPNFGVSVFEEFLSEQQNAAIQSARKQNVFLTKHLNVWVGAATAWMNMQKWQAQADAELRADDFIGCPAFAGCDLASKLDITAIVKVFRKRIHGADHYYVFGRYYVPGERVKEPELEHYRAWALNGHLQTTEGNVIDFPTITAQTTADCNTYGIREMGFDERYARQFAQEVEGGAGTVAVEIPQTTKFLSEPMKQLEALVIAGRLHHDGNPCMTWMMSNVVARVDANENVFPRKEKPENKIDGPVALINALARALVHVDPGPQAIEIW